MPIKLLDFLKQKRLALFWLHEPNLKKLDQQVKFLFRWEIFHWNMFTFFLRFLQVRRWRVLFTSL